MSIVEMPELVLEKIIGFSNFKDVLTLRQVCRDFRNFIDDLKDSTLRDSTFTTIIIGSRRRNNTIILNFMNCDSFCFEYSAMENSRVFHSTTRIFEDSNIVDVAIRDLELMLKFQKTILNRLYLYFDDFRIQKDSSIHSLQVKLSNMINVSGRKIRTRELSISTYDKSHVTSMLQLADPGTLECFCLSIQDKGMEMDIGEIAKTEQWKKAKTLTCDFFWPNLNVENICHFSTIYLKVVSVTARELDFLKKTFLSSSNFENLLFSLKQFNEQEELSNIWGPAFDTQLTFFWYFRMKDSDEKVLRIDIFYHNTIPRVYYAICFSIKEMRSVPNGAIVHDYNEN